MLIDNIKIKTMIAIMFKFAQWLLRYILCVSRLVKICLNQILAALLCMIYSILTSLNVLLMYLLLRRSSRNVLCQPVFHGCMQILIKPDNIDQTILSCSIIDAVDL